ncbi:TRAP transporter small permease [Vallitalea okinawensis]|uniref:TRAP transporter small permease n=1 Tax=Vallitalea okinawensis TaxID=2078660 RepID=UPI000CFB0D62|nr:TRAP transporter small permease [Vallitalea okinawensis]
MVKKIVHIIEAIFENIAMFFLAIMTIIISYQVFCRYFLNYTPSWSEEVSLLLMVWMGFLGIALGVIKGVHIGIEFFASILPHQIQKVLFIVDDLLVALFGASLLIYGYELVEKTMSSKLPATGWPAATLYALVPFCGLLIICFIIYKLIHGTKE